MTREVRLEERSTNLEDYARFIESNAGPRHYAVIRKFFGGTDSGSGASAPHGPRPRQGHHRGAREGLMKRTLESACLLSGILAWPSVRSFLHASSRRANFPPCHCVRAPQAFLSFKILIACSCLPRHTCLLDRAFGRLHLYLKPVNHSPDLPRSRSQ